MRHRKTGLLKKLYWTTSLFKAVLSIRKQACNLFFVFLVAAALQQLMFMSRAYGSASVELQEASSGLVVRVGQQTHILPELYVADLLNMLGAVSAGALATGMLLTGPVYYAMLAGTIAGLFPVAESLLRDSVSLIKGGAALWAGASSLLSAARIFDEVELNLAGRFSSEMSYQVCGKRLGRMPVYLEPAWLSSQYYFQVVLEAGDDPALVITPLPETETFDQLPLPEGSVSWARLHAHLSESGTDRLTIRLVPSEHELLHRVSVSEDSRDFEPEVIITVPAGSVWDLQALSSWCPRRNGGKLYSVFHPRTVMTVLEVLEQSRNGKAAFDGVDFNPLAIAIAGTEPSAAVLAMTEQPDYWLVYSSQSRMRSQWAGFLFIAESRRQPDLLLRLASSQDAEAVMSSLSTQTIWRSQDLSGMLSWLQWFANSWAVTTLRKPLDYLVSSRLSQHFHQPKFSASLPGSSSTGNDARLDRFSVVKSLCREAGSMLIEGLRPLHEWYMQSTCCFMMKNPPSMRKAPETGSSVNNRQKVESSERHSEQQQAAAPPRATVAELAAVLGCAECWQNQPLFRWALSESAGMIIEQSRSRDRGMALATLVSQSLDHGGQLLLAIAGKLSESPIEDWLPVVEDISAVSHSSIRVNVPLKFVTRLYRTDQKDFLRFILPVALHGETEVIRESVAEMLLAPLASMSFEKLERLMMECFAGEGNDWRLARLTYLFADFIYVNRQSLFNRPDIMSLVSLWQGMLTDRLDRSLLHDKLLTRANINLVKSTEHALINSVEVLFSDQLGDDPARVLVDALLRNYTTLQLTLNKPVSLLIDEQYLLEDYLTHKGYVEKQIKRLTAWLKSRPVLLLTNILDDLSSDQCAVLEQYGFCLAAVSEPLPWYEIPKYSRLKDIRRAIKSSEEQLSGVDLANILNRIPFEMAAVIYSEYDHWFATEDQAWIARHHPRLFTEDIRRGKFSRPEHVRLVVNASLHDASLAREVLAGKHNRHLTPDWQVEVAAGHWQLAQAFLQRFIRMDHARFTDRELRQWSHALVALSRGEFMTNKLLCSPYYQPRMRSEAYFAACVHHPHYLTKERCRVISQSAIGVEHLLCLLKYHGSKVFDRVPEQQWLAMDSVKLTAALQYHEDLCQRWLPHLTDAGSMSTLACAWHSVARRILEDSQFHRHLDNQAVARIQLVQQDLAARYRQLPQGYIGQTYKEAAQLVYDDSRSKRLTSSTLRALGSIYPALAEEILESGRFDDRLAELPFEERMQLYRGRPELAIKSARAGVFTRVQILQLAKGIRTFWKELLSHSSELVCRDTGQNPAICDDEWAEILRSVYLKNHFEQGLLTLNTVANLIRIFPDYPHGETVSSESLAQLPDEVLKTVCRDNRKASQCLIISSGLAAQAAMLDADPEAWLQILKKYPELTGLVLKQRQHCLSTGQWQELCNAIPAMYYRLLPDTVELPAGSVDPPPEQKVEPAVVDLEFIPATQSQWTSYWRSMGSGGCCAGLSLDFAASVLHGFHPMEYARQFFPAQSQFRQTATRDRIMHLQRNQEDYVKESWSFSVDKKTGEGCAALVDRLLELLPERKVLLVEGPKHNIAVARSASGSTVCFANNIGFYQFREGESALARERLEALILERFSTADEGDMIFKITDLDHDKLLKPVIKGRKQKP